jgi:hypothetical protein
LRVISTPSEPNRFVNFAIGRERLAQDAIVCNKIGCRQPILLTALSDRRASLLHMVTTTDLQVEKIAKRQHGLIAWRQLERLGVTLHQIRRRVRIGHWVRELPGVWRMSWAEPSWIQRVWCASLWAGTAACVSHRAAARLWNWMA